VHGDLLAGNVLVSPRNRVGAVLDWGNSLAGDPLYDLAWLMFWAPWHPGIDPVRVRRAARSRFGAAGLEERLLCYQLHIALDGMQYQAFAGRTDDLAATAGHASSLLR
jgi:hygromycin-B 4-O-kinase